VGEVLSQVQIGHGVADTVFTGKQNYCTTWKKLLTVIKAVKHSQAASRFCLIDMAVQES